MSSPPSGSQRPTQEVRTTTTTRPSAEEAHSPLELVDTLTSGSSPRSRHETSTSPHTAARSHSPPSSKNSLESSPKPSPSPVKNDAGEINRHEEAADTLSQQQTPDLAQTAFSGASTPFTVGNDGAASDHVDVEAAGADSRSSCHQPDRIRNIRDVRDAFVLTWHNQKRSLFTAWVHVPLGIVFLLFVCWVIKLGIDRAPFRFPAPVLAMAALFFSLLALDWLSIKYPGQDQSQIDPEKAVEQRKGSERKRFLDPIMKLVAPPCDFCLRNMSVMFTPSFILIPAREVIPGKEIGLLAAWFTISQVAAFVFPVLLYRALTWLEKQPKRLRERYQARRKREQDLRRIQSRRSSNATLAGSELAKQLSASGGNHRRLSVVAMGINDLTAIVTAPVAHLTMGKGKTRYEDERLQIEHVQIETARQQGDPAVATPAEIATMTGSPQGHWDGFFQHRQNHQHRHQHHHHRPHQPPALQRGRSLSKAVETGRSHSSSRGRNMRPTTPKRSQSVPAAPLEAVRPATPDAGTPKAEVHFHPSTIPAKSTEGQAQGAPRASLAEQLAAYSLDDMPQRRNLSVVFDDDAITDAGTRRPSRADSQATVENATNKLSFDGKGARINAAAAAAAADDDDGIDAEKKKVHYSKDQAARDSTESAKKPRVTVSDGDVDGDGDGHDDATRRSSDASQLSSECEDSAVERLSDWIADLITPAIYTILFVVGIPLFLVHDFALPLFLGINLLSFLAAITVIPPKWRRYLHPILTTSIATVFIIWCFGKAKGLSIRGVMDYYSNGAKYSVLWDLGGYSGPVPGAGDLLFSTLDAGIVALAVPMYRYRVDLAENFTRMMTILVPCASLSLFFWPWIGHLFGLDEVRSLAFTARFMSTPLAIEMANTVGADESITVIIVVITGILAAILKEPFFRMMRVDMDDHICVGVTMGSTAGAIGASSLISRPRVMAVASLAFVLFGTLLLICAAVPNIVDVVRQLCGAAPA